MSQVMHCKAHVSRQLAEHVWEVSVTLPEATKFEAGQYLMVVMGERDKRPFSIASAPTAHKEWLLHIGAPPDNSYATEVLDVIKDKGELTIEARSYWRYGVDCRRYGLLLHIFYFAKIADRWLR